MPPRGQTILCLCEAHQISTVPLPRIAYQSLCIPSIALPSLCFATQLQVMPSLHTAVEAFAVLYAATQRHCYALPHHAVAVQCLSSPLGAMPLPRDTMRFIAYPLHFVATPRYALALLCQSRPFPAPPLPLLAQLCFSVAVPLRAPHGYAFACHCQTQPCPRT